eukprot:1993980-Pyramimonas_sp.AAC.1
MWVSVRWRPQLKFTFLGPLLEVVDTDPALRIVVHEEAVLFVGDLYQRCQATVWVAFCGAGACASLRRRVQVVLVKDQLPLRGRAALSFTAVSAPPPGREGGGRASIGSRALLFSPVAWRRSEAMR